MKNFELINKKIIHDYNSEGFLYKHKNGANILFLKNNNQNRNFSISFKTLPENNKGIPHILEHILLKTSKNYIVKDIFNELLKSSLWTYLNGITYKDKTIYPVGSYDEKEFIKLVTAYLDGIYNPIFNNEVFLQESIKPIIKNNKVIDFNGIVFNEMLGTYSDTLEIFKQNNFSELFSNIYNFNSTGIPEEILNINYNEVLDFYKKFYTYNNSYIYFYGDLNINYYLELLEKYLNNENINHKEKNKQENINHKEKNLNNFINIKKYSVGNKNKEISISFLICDYTDLKNIYIFEILINYLFNKKIFNNKKISDSFIVEFEKETNETVFTIIFKNPKFNKNQTYNLFINEIKNIQKNNLDKNILLNCIKDFLFNLKEKDFGYKPEGLGLNLLCLNYWLNNKNVFEAFENYKIIEDIKKDFHLNKYIFVEILEEKILNNKNFVCSELNFSKNKKLSIEFIKNEKIKNLNNLELENLILQEEKIKKYNNKKDDLKEIEKFNVNNFLNIPKIDFNYIEETKNNIKNIFYLSNLEEIFIIKLMFKINTLNIEEIKIFGLKKLILENIINKNNFIRNLEFNFTASSKNCFLEISIKGFMKDINFIILEINKILNFDFKIEKSFLNKIIMENKLKLENDLLNNNFLLGFTKLNSNIYESYFIKDNLYGINFLNFLKKINDFEINKFEKLVMKKIFNKKNLKLFFTCSKK